MTDRELNLAICKEIERVAVKTWEQAKEKMQEGSYTANQVNDERDRFGNLDMEMATVEVGTFRCKFPICESFRLLHQFYRLCGTKDKERKHFIHMKKKQIMLDAEILIDNQHKVLEKMVETDKLCEIMMLPYLDVKRSMIVASDGKVLGAFRVGITVYSGKAEGVSLPLKMVAKPGIYHVTAYGDGSCLAVGNGVTYSCKMEGEQRFPDYIRVINAVTLSQERHYCVTDEGVKALEKFFKSLKSVPGNGGYIKGNNRYHHVRLYARNGEQTIHVQYKEEEYHNELACDIPMAVPCRSDLNIMLPAEYTMRLLPAWNGSLWYQDMTSSVMFDTNTEDTMIQQPCLDTNPPFAISCKRDGETMVQWEERYNQHAEASAEAPKHRSEETPKRRSDEKPKRRSKAPKLEVMPEVHLADEETEETKPDDARMDDVSTYSGGVTVKRSRCIVGSHFFPLLEVRGDDGTETLVAGTSLFRCISDKDGEIRPEYAELFRSIDAFVDDHLLIADPLDEEAICRQVNQFIDMLEDAAKELDKHNIKAN